MASSRTCKVAIVEDEQQYQEMFHEYVSRYGREHGIGTEITVFSDGLDITEDYRAEWDVIFMDIQMRHMDGMEAARRIRKRDEKTAIVFIPFCWALGARGRLVHSIRSFFQNRWSEKNICLLTELFAKKVGALVMKTPIGGHSEIQNSGSDVLARPKTIHQHT